MATIAKATKPHSADIGERLANTLSACVVRRQPDAARMADAGDSDRGARTSGAVVVI
jgi:hypothetical protein